MSAGWPAFQLRGSDSLVRAVEQIAHGFEAGSIVKFDGAAWVNSQSDSVANCYGSFIVSQVIDVDNFQICSDGFVENLTLQDPYTVGETYYLSADNPGELVLVANRPNHVGQVIFPCFYAETTTSGQFWGGAGVEITSGMILNDFLNVTTNTKMKANSRYVTEGASSFNLELPDTLDFLDNDIIEIYCNGTGQITITQPAFTAIQIVEQTTTPGVGGTLTLQQTGGAYKGSLILKCTTIGLIMSVIGGTGQWTPA